MTKWKIYNEDAVEWAKNYQKGKFHALLCDAPYHLTSIVKRFGKAKMSDNTKTSEKVRNRVDGYSRLINTGFMGQKWDGGDIAFRPETWEAFKEVLYPGAFGMAFSASRNWHRMAVAIEDAGFIIHPTMFFLWIQSQGFPKATNIAKQLNGNGKTWEGHRYGLQALKPSVEPIIVFQKPYDGRPLDNIVSTGAGALNIDGGRIPLATDDEYTINTFDDGAKPFGNGAGHKYSSRKVKAYTPNGKNKVYGKNMGGGVWNESSAGRWPANLILDENIKGLDQSHFFYQVSTQLDEADPFYYCSKVSRKERNAGLDEKNPHPTLKPIALAKYLAALLLPPAEYAPRRIFIPFSGVASEMCGAGLVGWEHVVGVESDTENGYVEIANKRLEYWLK